MYEIFIQKFHTYFLQQVDWVFRCPTIREEGVNGLTYLLQFEY